MNEQTTAHRLKIDIPDTFNILQAALWLVRGRKPVADSIFVGAPLELANDEIDANGPLGDLIYALRAGKISASGGAATCLRYDPRSSPHPYPWVWPHQEYELFPIKPQDWHFSRVSWNGGYLDYKPLLKGRSFSSDGKVLTFSGDIPSNILCSTTTRAQEFRRHFNIERDSFCYFPVVIPKEDFLRTFPHLSAPEPGSPDKSEAGAKSRPDVGRPEKYDWEWLYIEAGAWIFENGYPVPQQKLIDAMLDLYSEHWGKGQIPGESTMKSKLRPVLDRYERDQN